MNRPFTKEWRREAGWLLMLFTGLSLSGCQAAHMAFPYYLWSESSELTVEGRFLSIFRDSFHFGPYHVSDFHLNWTRGGGNSRSIGAFDFSRFDAKQKYEFAVKEPDRSTWAVQCVTTADGIQLETEGFLGGRFGVVFSSNQQLVCALKQESRKKLSKLVMARSASAGETALQGMVTDGTT